MERRQVILVILDGWGIGPQSDCNAIYIQGTPNFNYLKENFLTGALKTSAIAINSSAGIEGNAEGHPTLGAGKIIYQHYSLINIAIKDGSFMENPVFLNAFDHVRKYQSSLNLAGLISEGNIHASFHHLSALIKLAKRNGMDKINLHLFSDGKDSEPNSVLKLIGGLLYEAGIDDTVKIASISGRYFALDREEHWDRTQKVYQAMTGDGPLAENLEQLVDYHYKNGLNDFYIEPHIINRERIIKDNDALIFFDFREDGLQQIVSTFALPDFNKFPTKKFNNLYIATLTHYSDKFNVPVAYEPEKIANPLGKILADNGKTQLRIAETEKYAYITYYFNGFQQEPFKNEFRILIPSENLLNYSEKPEMRSGEITARTIRAIGEDYFDFILANYASPDMISHTGNFEAAKKTVKVIDEEMGKLAKAVLDKNAVLIITSDHGNIESMCNPETGQITTSHNTYPVPIYIIGKEFIKNKNPEEAARREKEIVGTQADVAPTILEILGIPAPPEMTGKSLLQKLKQ